MKKIPKKKFFPKKKKHSTPNFSTPQNLENLRLNKFMAHCGVGTRRACEVFIQKGLVKVNDEVVTESAYRVQKNDVVSYEGKVLKIDKKYVYILLNKPKGYLPTFEKSETEKSFHNIFGDKIQVEISPIGNLEKDSVGLLLLTDDDFLIEKYNNTQLDLKSIFHLVLTEPITKEALKDFQKTLISNHPNIQSISHVKEKGENEIGIEMKGGSDSVLKNALESSGFSIEKLDRVFLNGLTKKDLPRGRFRMLSEKETIFLKHFSITKRK